MPCAPGPQHTDIVTENRRGNKVKTISAYESCYICYLFLDIQLLFT